MANGDRSSELGGKYFDDFKWDKRWIPVVLNQLREDRSAGNGPKRGGGGGFPYGQGTLGQTLWYSS